MVLSMEYNNKMIILTLIHENSEILFGKFSNVLTHEDKIKKWKEIAGKINAMGIFHKDWKYLRDTTWQNWRKRTMEKRENRQKTESMGRRKFKYDDTDELIFKIVQKNPSYKSETSLSETPQCDTLEHLQPIQFTTPVSLKEESPMPNFASAHNEINMPIPMNIYDPEANTSTSRSVSEIDTDEEMNSLKKQKLEAEIKLIREKVEIAKRERYKLDLELLKLERELKMSQPSNYTSPYINTTVKVEPDL